jgi:UDP-N-acetylmuramoyl-tripeptide--D-alanyl-D-alanine ligase
MASAIPDNHARFTLGEIADVTKGTLSGSAEVAIEGVVTDSRVNAMGKLFIALPGEHYDGHAFVTAALRSGARALLVERDVGKVTVPVVRVASTFAALGELGRAHRRRWSGRLVAVAGSAGKTTTRSAVAAALSAIAPGAVHFAAGNLNNRVGVPFVLFGLEARHRHAVVEIGTNALGEVAALTRIAAPDVAVLTLIGLEHSEGLGSIEQIADEEGSLFAELGPNAVAIGNADDERVARRLEGAQVQTRLRYGFAANSDYRVIERTTTNSGSQRVTLARPQRPSLSIECPLLGRPGAYALAAAVAVADAAGEGELRADDLEAALRRGGTEPGRLVPIELAGGTLVLDDTYNSNPASLGSSVTAAEELAEMRGGRLVLVLGEMRELGEDSPRLHRESGAAIAQVRAALAVGVGGDARWLLEPLAERGTPIFFAADVAAALPRVVDALRAKDVVLVKASRGVRAERIVEGLVTHFGRAK